MPTVSKVFNPADIFQGPADIYVGVKAPPSANPPVQGTNTLVLDGNGQPPIGATGQLATVTVASGGTGYAVGDDLVLVQSGASSGVVRVVTAPAGVVGTVLIVKDGIGYATGAGLATIPLTGSGTGATITINTITSGYHYGLTEGPAMTNINPKFNFIHADQFAADIDSAFVSLACEIDFTMKEYQLHRLERTFGGIFTSTYFDLAAGGTNPAADLLQIGNTQSSQTRTTTLMLVAPRRDAPGKYIYILAYKVYIKSAIAINVARAKESDVKLKFACLADTTRVAKDMVMQIVRMQ